MPPKGYKLSAQAKENIRQGGLKYHIEAQINRDELYSLYWDKQLSAREIGGLKGVTDGCVFNWLRRLNIPRRSPSEFTKLAYEKHPYPLVGESHPQWKGMTRHSGYIYIHIYPDHPFYCMAQKGGWVAEHRLVMARHISRALLPWEVVHHINGIKDDNRIENLELLPSNTQHIPSIRWQMEISKRDIKIADLEQEIKSLKKQ